MSEVETTTNRGVWVKCDREEAYQLPDGSRAYKFLSTLEPPDDSPPYFGDYASLGLDGHWVRWEKL